MKAWVSGKRYPVSMKTTLMSGRTRVAMAISMADSAPKLELMTRRGPNCAAAQATTWAGSAFSNIALTVSRSRAAPGAAESGGAGGIAVGSADRVDSVMTLMVGSLGE